MAFFDAEGDFGVFTDIIDHSIDMDEDTVLADIIPDETKSFGVIEVGDFAGAVDIGFL
jgi:hypothetical protein